MRILSASYLTFCTGSNPAANSTSIGLPGLFSTCRFVFAGNLDNFTMTRQPSYLYPDCCKNRSSKRATYYTAGPLGVRVGATWQPVFVREFRLDVTIFCHLSGLSHLDKFLIPCQLLTIYLDFNTPAPNGKTEFRHISWQNQNHDWF